MGVDLQFDDYRNNGWYEAGGSVDALAVNHWQISAMREAQNINGVNCVLRGQSASTSVFFAYVGFVNFIVHPVTNEKHHERRRLKRTPTDSESLTTILAV